MSISPVYKSSLARRNALYLYEIMVVNNPDFFTSGKGHDAIAVIFKIIYFNRNMKNNHI